MQRLLLIVLLLVLAVASFQHQPRSTGSARPETSEADFTYASPRSPQWRAFRNHFVSQRGGVCEACGTTDNPHLHHIKSFHEYPELELSPLNVIILCGPKGNNCHFKIGHDPDGPSGPLHPNWKKNNPHVVRDAAWQLRLQSQ